MAKRKPRKKARGALHVVVGLLVASAIIRLASEAGPAIAQVAQIDATVQEKNVDAPANEDSFLAALQAREARLEEREASVDAKMRLMQDARAELDEQMRTLTAAETTLQATIAMAEAASANDVMQLAAVYENMKPKEAAALFAEMSPEFAAGFLGLMRPDIVAAIMTELSPEVAYSFSVVLAGRNANTPTE